MSCTPLPKAAKPVWAKQLTRLPCLVVYVKFQFVYTIRIILWANSGCLTQRGLGKMGIAKGKLVITGMHSEKVKHVKGNFSFKINVKVVCAYSPCDDVRGHVSGWVKRWRLQIRRGWLLPMKNNCSNDFDIFVTRREKDV